MPFFRVVTGSKDLTIVIFVMAILAIIIVPLPGALLDFFLTISIAVAVLIILISLYIPKPTDLTTFPTLILIVTLFRLALNIATTRMILSHGHEGPEEVSSIITSFGNFVVGGNYVIGIIVFLILVLINFMVITKGSGRVAEVAARFTLDSMPGKQMAVDADLNAGLIEEPEARKRREGIIQEANFYGAMDGSSKFVKGDATAGIIITAINIIGGFLIGIFQFDLSAGDAAATYTILTIGDGLVSQIPALIMSTATGIIITRATKDEKESFAEGAIDQLIGDYKVMTIVGAIMLMFAMVPGLPTASMGFVGFIFLGLSLMLYYKDKGTIPFLSDYLKERNKGKDTPKAPDGADSISTGEGNKPKRQLPTKSPETIKQEEEATLEDILKTEMLELTLGYELIRLADSSQGGDLLDRIRSMRRKIASDFGFLMPQVRIRDNLHLEPRNYQILLKGSDIGSGEIYPEKYMAMDSGMAMDTLTGIDAKEPAFGLDATWINLDQKEHAIMEGYTVVDPATVISTHMSELVKQYAEELLTRQETQSLIDKLKENYSVVVDDLLANASIGLVQRVLKQLLHDKVPLKDMLTILETIADVAEITKNVDVLVEHVRAALSRVITNLYKNEKGIISLLSFDTQTEQRMLEVLQDSDGTRQLMLNVQQINALIEAISEAAASVLQMGHAQAILIVDPMLRKAVADIIEKFSLQIVVLSHAEVDSSAQFEVLGSISANLDQ
jgi:flagellar biosynthesis protein FlhA